MACDLFEKSIPIIASVSTLTESPIDDSDDSTGSELTPIVSRFICGQPAQSYNIYNRHLPYASSLESEAANYFKQIKTNLGKCMLLSVHKTDCVSEVKNYITLYGQYFTKEDHILLIKMFFQAMQIPGIEMSTLTAIISILNSLLRKQRLISPKELTIEWRPFYDIYCKYIFERKNLFQIGQSYGFESNLRNLIEISRIYFSIEATREILDELRPVQCPFTACKIFRYSFLLGLFLPTQMFPEHHAQGFKLWFDEILALWSGPNAIQYENIFFKLLARLATHNIGYIDWTPYMSLIFTKYTKAMNNSVSQSPLALLALSTDCTSVVNWIVSMIGGPHSKAMDYIESLFKAIESNFHPSNMSGWNSQLTNILSRLSSAFINRIYRERYRKRTWEPRTPKEYQISEAEIDKFVDILLPILMTAMFSRFGTGSVFTTIRDLAWLRPEKVIPPLVEKLYIALDSNLEAHRLNSLMSALSIVVPSMVNGLNRYEEGKTHLIDLLFSSLPGLDCNDIKKCGNTFGLITNLVDSVPLLDCSAMVDIRDDLTETECNIAIETSRFEEFVLIYLEKVLTLVENYSPEHRPEKIDNEPVKQSSDESYFESSMIASLSMVLSYSSPQIFDRALDKLFVFLRGRLFESRSTIKLMAFICGLFSNARPETVIEKFLPYLHSTILGLTDNDDVFDDESVDAQLSLALQIAAEIIVEGDVLAQYEERIFDIIRRGLRLKPNQGYKPASLILKNCLESLTTIYPSSNNSFSLSWEQLSDFKNINPIRLWGKHEKLDDIAVNWHVPSHEEMAFAQRLLDEFLISELKSLKDWTEGSFSLSREAVHRSLHVVLFCMAGSSCVLPPFDSEEYVILDTLVPPPRERVHEIGTKHLQLSSGVNPRQLVAESTQLILKHISSHCDDDTKSLDLIIKIYQCVLGWIKSSRFMKINRDNYSASKKNLHNKLVGRKKLPRRILIDRIRLQHETRIAQKTWGKFTYLHRDLILDLFALGLSHYSDVRAKAHSALSHFKHPFGYRLIASELTKVFSKKRTGETEEIQGALSILLNHHSASFMAISDWECITPLWLAFINSDYSEKPIIILLLEQLSKHATTKLQPLLINFELSPQLRDIGKLFFTIGTLPDITMPDEDAIKNGHATCEAANEANYKFYVSFVHQLVEAIESGRLHWRHLQFSFLLLQSLIRKDIKFPTEGVRIIVKNLINDHIAIRRICINGVAAILRQHKPAIKFDYTFVDLKANEPSSYDWLFFKPGVDYMDEAVWNSTKWVNRTFISPNYCASEGIKYYTEASALQARDLSSVGPDEALILEFFLDKSKVTKLLDFITLDDKKTSLLGPRRFKLFQGLFRNFGIITLDVFRDFFENMTKETKENVHKCGCDVLTGLVRGSKYWPYKDIITLRDLLEPIVKKLLKTISRETTEHYVEFCSFGFRRLDGRRFSWLFLYLIDDPLCSSDTTATSFQSFSRFKILSDLLISQCWRAMPYLRHLFDHILKHKHLKNPYQNIRQLIGCSLTQLLQFDNDFFKSSAKSLLGAPKIDELLQNVLPELEAAALNEKDSPSSLPMSQSSLPMVVADSNSNSIDEVEKESCNLLTTICYWLHPHLSLNPYITRPQILQLVPIICEIKNRSKDDELTASANEALISIGQCSIKENFIDSAISVCKKMTESKSWHTRISVINFIQLMVSSNLFTLMNDRSRNQMISDMIIDLLQDERMEVREKAAGLLGGLIHYQFIKVDKTLINRFRVKCSRKLTRSTQNYGYDSSELNEKHGGALGLCSIVSAYPYDVPEFLPDILMFLGDHLHDPQPIPTTIRKTLSDFKRTHYDNWRQHKEKFNEDQIAIITDLLVSPNYYA